MYVAKIVRKNLLVDVSVWEKSWSKEMFSNELSLIARRGFFIKSSARTWAAKVVAQQLIEKESLEIVYG